MLRELIVRNFKVFGESRQRVTLAPLTILVGKNSSGKTSVLDAIALLAQTARRQSSEPGFRWNGSLVDFDGPKSVLHRGNLSSELELGVQLNCDSDFANWFARTVGSESVPSLHSFGYTVTHGREAQEWRHELWVDEEVAATNILERVDKNIRTSGYQPVLHLSFQGIAGAYRPNAYGESILDPQLFSPGANLQSSLPPPPEARQKVRLLEIIMQFIRDYLRDKIYLVGPDRMPTDETPNPQKFDFSVGRSGQDTLNVLNQIFSSPEFASTSDKIQEWSRSFGLQRITSGWARENKLKAGFSDPQTNSPMQLKSAGFGSQQMLPIVVQLFAAPPNSVVMLEEPEISLHPEAHISLIELFADAVSSGRQVIVTTHSPTLLLALSHAQGLLEPSEVRVYHLNRDQQMTSVTSLPIDERWVIENWVPSFSEVERDLMRSWITKVHDDIARKS